MAKGNAIVMYLEQARIHGEPIGVTHSEVLFTKPNGYTVQPHNRVVSKADNKTMGESFLNELIYVLGAEDGEKRKLPYDREVLVYTSDEINSDNYRTYINAVNTGINCPVHNFKLCQKLRRLCDERGYHLFFSNNSLLGSTIRNDAMDNTQNLGQPVGKVTTTYNGEKIQVNVYADRSVILPDGTVRKVKQEVVDALIAKNQAMNPASTIVRMAPAKPRMTQPEPSQEQVQQPAARVQEPAQPSYQPQMQMPAQPQQPVMPQNAAVPEMQYQNEPVQQGYDTQMNAPADMPAQDIPAPLAQDPAAEQNASDKKQMFHKGKGKDKKNAPADKKRGKAKAAPAEVQGEGFDGNMPVEKPKKKSKAGVIVAVVLAAVIGGGALGYAYVPAVYDGVNNVLTAVTGKQVGVPAPIPSNTGDGNAPTVSQPQLQQSSGTSENALNGIDLSGDVTIEFYATVRTADGREYKVPLSSANLTDGNLKSLLDGSGFTLTSGQ